MIFTDEVFVSIENGSAIETSKFNPSSPYAATKAAAELLVNSYFVTYGCDVVITRCTNNYGPRQNPEKLIPLCIKNLINKKNIPVYGNGLQIRDWINVSDHCEAINKVLHRGKIGEIYNIGSSNEKINLNLIKIICKIFDEIDSKKNFSHISLIKHVKDRLGHDKRYSINSSKIRRELNWKPKISFNEGIKKTIKWYLKNHNWK